MFHDASRLAELIAVLGTLCGMAYYLVCIWSANRFLRKRQAQAPSTTNLPAISILKPLKGTDPGMAEAFRSHCVQNYPDYEIIFGVSDAADPAIGVVDKLKNEFPDRAIRLVVCSEILGTNVKVSNLVQMARQGRHDIFVVNDSDILVPANYLLRLMNALSEPNVGLVSCLYRARPAETLGSRLEALGIGSDFSAGVLVAQELEGGLRFGLGSTLAFRRRDLEGIGGFESLLEYLADDYQLGARICQRGLLVKLSEMVVETFLPAYSYRDFIAHQLRWARTIRDSRLWGYLGLVTTFGLPWSLLVVLLAKGALWAWVLLGVTVVLRLAMAMAVGKFVLQDRGTVSSLWLIPLRDLLGVFVWTASFFGNTVRWRGDKFRLVRGRLVKMTE
jgi:ceramide glucosyltransferase